jgi:hypothetical protein
VSFREKVVIKWLYKYHFSFLKDFFRSIYDFWSRLKRRGKLVSYLWQEEFNWCNQSSKACSFIVFPFMLDQLPFSKTWKRTTETLFGVVIKTKGNLSQWLGKKCADLMLKVV